MAVTRINNNQITDASTGNVYVGINASTKVQDYSITSGKIANSLVYGSDLTISGNLTVNGQTTTIDTVSTVIEDPVIVLASNQTGTPAVDIGFIGERGDQNNIAFVWDESADEFVTAFTTDLVTNTVITIASYANFHTNDANIGGNITINGTTSLVGNISSALNVTGNVTGGNLNTAGQVVATGNINGAGAVFSGNVTASNFIGNISGNIDAGGANTNIQFNDGDVLAGSAAFTFNKDSNAVVASGNITAANAILSATTASTSRTTGALKVAGGVGVAGDLYAGNSIVVDGGAYGNVTTTQFASVFGSGGGPNPYSVMQVRASDGASGIGMQAFTGSGTLYGNTAINFVTGATIRDRDVYSGGTVRAFLDSTGLTVTGIANISGNVTGGNITTAGQVVATGNITGGNLITAGTFESASISATGNITGGNLITAGITSTGSLTASTTINATGNITGGNLSAGSGIISTTGNVNGANVNASSGITAGTTITATGNITGGNLSAGSGIISTTGNIDGGNLNLTGGIFDTTALTITTATGNLNLSPAGNIVLGNRYVNGVAYPSQDQDAASKIYVDNLVSTSISYHEAVVAATTTTLATATGGTVTYDNGTAGVGATLTTTGAFNLIDTANVQTANTRILVKNEANATHNGVYVWSNATAIVRSSDTNTYGAGNVDALGINDYFFVTGGDVNEGSAWIVDSPTGTITFGTSNIAFAQFSQSQVYSANTSAGIVLNSTTFSAKVDGITTAFDGGGNIIVKASANLTTPNIGAATGTSLNVTGNITGGNVTTAGITATGSLTASTTIDATGNITGGNLSAGSGIISTTGNINGANVNTSAGITAGTTITAIGNITGGNVTTAGITSTGSLTASTTINATGNITGGNLTTGGTVNATGNVNGTGAVFSGNVTASNFIGNISGNIDAGGANTNIQFNDGDVLAGSAAFTFDKTSNAVVASGNITGGNINTAGQVVATGNITGGNLITAGLGSFGTTITATGNITGGNVGTAGQVTATGNITGGNVIAVALVTGANVTATSNVTGANVVGTTSVIGGNIVISGDNITDTNGRVNFNTAGADVDFAVNGDTVANIFYIDAGTGTASFGSATQTTNAVVAFNATNSVLMPVGNIAQRPGTGVTGMLRFNTTADALEVYDNSSWTTVGVPSFTVIADEQFNGDGSTVAFTLGSSQTTASCIVSINGVVQIPTIAYSVSGTTLTFTEAPEPGDIIDVREITTTTTVTSISNLSGNAAISVSDTSNDVSIDGDLIPTSNITQNLGSSTFRWNELYLAGNTITLGNTVIKNTSGNTIGFFGPDGVTPATIDSASVDTTTIANGTSSMSVIASGGNIRANVGGTTVQTISAGLVAITGDLSVTGNATLSGNILGDRVVNGTTSFEIQTPSGNANISIGGTSNVAVFTTTGLAVAGTVSVSGTGNITGANLVATSDVFTPEIVKTGSNAVGNIGQSSNYFNTVFAQATSALYADLAEKYVADAEYIPGTVVVFGGDKEVTVSSTDADRAVAGVVSTNPSYIMNAGLDAEHVATVALTGRVPCRVTGTVRKGDLMVSAGYGLARADQDPKVGTVIGKALENHEGTEGVIEVVVGRF